MKILSDSEEKEAMIFLNEAAKIALNAKCNRAKCGSIIVNEGEIIGAGFNSPPKEIESQRRCGCEKDKYDLKVTDKTCCMHAEQRAIFDALRKNPEKINGSRLYFVRVDDEGKLKKSAKPYCTICSKSALDVGIAEFVLFTDFGIEVYDTCEYNDKSFEYKN